MSSLSAETIKNIQNTIDTACADQKSGIPGTTVVVVDRNGEELIAHAGGKRGSGSDEPMTLDSVYWIASCTKMIVGFACMQLVERGMLKLDDADHLDKLCPELKSLKVLQDDGKLVEQKNRITLRMLLSHTAGFGYTFFNEKLRDFSYPVGFDEFSGAAQDLLQQPLVHQPGEDWEYGVNIDWAGFALERATKMSLNEYIQTHIFNPLGLENITMHPRPKMRAALAHMHYRRPDGSLVRRDHLLHRPLVPGMKVNDFFHSGGAGCFAKPGDYVQILATLLNGGVSPKTHVKLLEQSTVDMMFQNQITKFPNFGRKGIPDAKPELTNPIPDLYPVPESPEQGWGLTFMLSNGGVTGRSTGTGHWAGLPNCWWWCDRESGVAGMVCTQILPFADAKVLGMWFDVETQVYTAIRSGK
ncbi:beta-lactamase/transpeptidase-like protein [Rhizodiscina lignyota]|uniref:Beta-lactamase/transpeptidase-like protein n=1 Tax=Rhizodiscina lignyota TaxID=1504668 RepID=A0A9P4IHU5_9PEZI|nr:beta-lactamase/transpeptidase-like protein [Rhizodiscina lignyota]